MVNRLVKRQHILDALAEIDRNEIPRNRRSTRYNLFHNDKFYPPKYVLSIATRIATGKELEPSKFNGGNETNRFLSNLGFQIREEITKLNTENNETINICTAIVQIPTDNWDKIRNNEKFELLSKIVTHLENTTDVLVLPAGFLNSKNKKPETIFEETEETIVKLLNKLSSKLFVCLGIDGRNKSDQLALTINNTGIIAIARKFHHTNNDICLADNAFSLENGKERQFSVKSKHGYLAVCYDIFGISQLKLQNELKSDFIIGVIHGFGNSGGDSDFARKGLAGASKQWRIHSYASAVFSDNRNPTNWTSGVAWRHGDKSVKDYKYDQIRIDSRLTKLTTDIATIYLRHYEEKNN